MNLPEDGLPKLKHVGEFVLQDSTCLSVSAVSFNYVQ